MMYEDENIICTPKRCALTEVTNSTNYVSPNANLKLLTSVALQDKNLISYIASQYPTPPPSTIHRKEKSLQILCDRFLELYPLNGNGTVEIQLDCTAARLGVEKRRMYDIINILEAMQCAVHKRKNTYLWYGGARLNPFLKMLKKEGENLRLSDALRGKAPKPPAPKHKTLGIMAQRFLMLFLVEPPNTLLNLEMAVRVLIDISPKNRMALSPEQQDRQHKSKVRRLYDIANVFISVGLIEKVPGTTILKKPVFKYCGPIKIKKSEETVVYTPPITPLSTLGQRVQCHVFAGKSKRKLEFTSPAVFKNSKFNSKQLDTPSHKWNEILLVADMELTKINCGKKL